MHFNFNLFREKAWISILHFKNYVIPGTNVEIQKGQVVQIPTPSIMKDPKYYDNPEKFDPLRFR